MYIYYCDSCDASVCVACWYCSATDASGHGFCVVAIQWDERTGRLRPIAFFSKGWIGPQIKWNAQVKECHAQRYAVTKMMPSAFPYANIVLMVDNRNLATEAMSEDNRISRWQQEIKDSGCAVRYWIPGSWNTIADYGSRSVVADPSASLSVEDDFERYVYTLASVIVDAGGSSVASVSGSSGSSSVVDVPVSDTVVPGHLSIAPLLAKIVTAQEEAGVVERASWKGPNYSTVLLAGRTIYLYRNRSIVPSHANDLKRVLMRMTHDDEAHFPAVDRQLWALRHQARVYWVGMDDDVAAYVKSCFRCAFAKPRAHGPARVGQLTPTLAPYPHHTWYVDLKGPLPHGTGYIMCVVEAFSRMVIDQVALFT